jgi:hypothetical protein
MLSAPRDAIPVSICIVAEFAKNLSNSLSVAGQGSFVRNPSVSTLGILILGSAAATVA